MVVTKVFPLVFSILLHGVASQNNLRSCRLYVVRYICIPGEDNCPDTTLDCELEDQLYPIYGVSRNWIEEQVSTEQIVSGESELIVSSYQISVDGIEIPEGSLDALEIKTDRRRRRLGPAKTGPSTVLVVRIKATDVTNGEPAYSESELSNYFFGTGSGTSLLSQMDACSSGQTTVVPAVHASMSFPGVVEVDIGIPLNGFSGDPTISVIRGAAISKLVAAGIPYADYDSINFVIYNCSPASCPFGGYAAVNGWYSLYRGSYATMSSVMMHTYGHQMGLYGSDAQRSGGSFDSDGDATCSMGKTLYEVDAHMCYNAVKHKDLGWFSSGAYNGDLLVPSAELPAVHEIIGYAEWNSGAEELPVSLTIDSKFVVSFNRAVGVNADTVEGIDKVIVHDAEAQSNGNSLLVAVLDVGEEHEYIFEGTTTDIFVKVCKIGGDTSVIAMRALVLVYDSSVGVSSCTSVMPSKLPSDQPSKLPSKQPSKMPSDQPSKMPSDQPSKMPSDQPSKMPSDQPSKMPSDQPSKMPSDQPSKLPSEQPSELPSKHPSKLPSIQPSKLPSEQPSKTPSDQPSQMPSKLPSDQPSKLPSYQPSKLPSKQPSKMPSDQPSKIPSDQPSKLPSDQPSDLPSKQPSEMPSDQPSKMPSDQPSKMPSNQPSTVPSLMPSDKPSLLPSKLPSDQPSKIPSDKPSLLPSKIPSDQPTKVPSDQPTGIPSFTPTSSPSGCATIDDCDDGDVCTIDRCDKFHECSHEVIPKCCESVKDCDDKQVCTIDTCYNNRCKYELRPNFCCDASDCDDGNSCTIDECESSKCKNIPIEGCCEIKSDCDDGDPCTLHQCVKGKCKDKPKKGCCTRANDCRSKDKCLNFRCEYFTNKCKFRPVKCNDKNKCTKDSCSKKNGKCAFKPIKGCSCRPKQDPCTTPEQCCSSKCKKKKCK